MSYFDNANNKVTRKSFGSKVDKEFKREGVIPVRDRKKNEKDMVAEAAKYQELNKKVDARRLEDMKNVKSYETAMQEGYKNLKDVLIKDFISEICVEALLVDEDVVLSNLNNIVEMVNVQIDDIGGFEGVKRIAENTNNPVLKNMISVCEATCKKVGERNLKESGGDAKKVDFNLTKIELDDYDYRKKEMGSETIVNNIKDKVFQVVQDEQKLSSDRQMVMDEIQNKVSELEAPVEEAMKFIFESAGVEEDTLFNSLMRSHYKGLLESNSSAIFETMDYRDEQEPLFEEHEFVMSDIELVDEELEDEDIRDMFMEECYNIKNNLTDDNFEESLELLYNKVYEGSQNILAKKQAKHYKSIVRDVQNEIEGFAEVPMESKSYVEEMFDYDEVPQLSVTDVRSKLLKLYEANDELGNMADEMKDFEKSITKDEKAGDKIKEKAAKDGQLTEEVILCPKCGKEECSCKVAKESIGEFDVVEEGNAVVNKMANVINASMYKKIAKRDFEPVRGNLTAKIKGIKTTKELDLLAADFKLGIKQLEEAKRRHPDQKEKLDKHIKWLKTDGKKMLADQKRYIEKQKLAESYVSKLEDICETMNVIIEAHDVARVNVIESLTHNIDDQETLVPYLQTKDVNLSNLEFAYKTKMVCESLKKSLKPLRYLEEVSVLNKAVELNLKSIEETLEVIKENSSMEYKVHILNMGKKYLEKLHEVMESRELESNEEVLESASLFKTPEDIEKVFSQVREYYIIESTDKDLMELVMAEAIVEYTILETMNTLNLIKYTKDSVRQMARKNISK